MVSKALRLTVITLDFVLGLMLVTGGAVSVWAGLNGSVIVGYFFLFHVNSPAEMVSTGTLYVVLGLLMFVLLAVVLKKDLLSVRSA